MIGSQRGKLQAAHEAATARPHPGAPSWLNERLRHAFIEGAEEDSRRRLGRGLTTEELERVLRR